MSHLGECNRTLEGEHKKVSKGGLRHNSNGIYPCPDLCNKIRKFAGSLN